MLAQSSWPLSLLVRSSSPPSAWLTACGGATLCLLALVRPTWIIVMPLFALVTSRQSTRGRAIAVAASLIVGAVMLMIFNVPSHPTQVASLRRRLLSIDRTSHRLEQFAVQPPADGDVLRIR